MGTRRTSDVMQMEYHNPHASMPLVLPIQLIRNTDDEVVFEQIRRNARRALPWIAVAEPHDGVAIICGGGPSIRHDLDEIRQLNAEGGMIFGLNAASQFMNRNGFLVDYQVICDAKQETSSLVDPYANRHLFASQCHPDTFDAVESPVLWHLGGPEIEEVFPPEKRQKGGYALVGGGAAVGNSAVCLAYAIGYRRIHCFGFDSSYEDDRSHAYPQPMNQFMPTTEVEWAGRTYRCALAMKAQAEKFQITAQQLKAMGCEVVVHGEGLLPAMYNTKPEHLSERNKYKMMWQIDAYRDYSPGEMAVGKFQRIAGLKPGDKVVDYGCGTGRASLQLQSRGIEVFLIDFVDNCRDEEALTLPFLEADLTHPLPIRWPYGMCCDVMEHIPTGDVARVIDNITQASDRVFFQISTVPDSFGNVIGQTLHNTVKNHEWWARMFARRKCEILWQEELETQSCFYVTRNLSDRT